MKRTLMVSLTVPLSGCIDTDIVSPGKVHSTTGFNLNSGDFMVIDQVSTTGKVTL